MNISRRLRLSVLAALELAVFAAPIMSMAAYPGIKGISLDQDRASFNEAHPGTQCTTGDFCTIHDTIGGAGGDFMVTIQADRVVSVSIVNIDSSEFDSVVGALVSKFGKPTLKRAGVVSNMMGAKFDDLTVDWAGKGWQIHARKRADSVTKSEVLMFTTKYTQQLQKSQAKTRDDI
jgi:hypothetical protein